MKTNTPARNNGAIHGESYNCKEGHARQVTNSIVASNQKNLERPTPQTPSLPTKGLPDTDLHRARCFAARLDGGARYIVAWKQWATWERDKWKLDESGKQGNAIKRKAAEFADELMVEARRYPLGRQRKTEEAVARKLRPRPSAQGAPPR